MTWRLPLESAGRWQAPVFGQTRIETAALRATVGTEAVSGSPINLTEIAERVKQRIIARPILTP
jgi:hypothetical protein